MFSMNGRSIDRSCQNNRYKQRKCLNHGERDGRGLPFIKRLMQERKAVCVNPTYFTSLPHAGLTHKSRSPLFSYAPNPG